MNLLQQKIKSLYFKYLAAAFGSAIISSVYGIVDIAMVGQYQGPTGTAALTIVAPIWNIIYSLGLLTGIGGSVFFSMARGAGKGNGREENEYFTVALGTTLFLALICWLVILFFDKPMLMLFGADDTLLALAGQYLFPVKLSVPFFLLNQMLSAFIRNDARPELATAAVLIGGIFNVVGDYIFVFVLDYGIFGAGLATALGAMLTFGVMLTHFFSHKNTLRLIRPQGFLVKLKRILTTGFSTFLIDVAMGVLTMLFNRQIMKYAGTSALAVYGIIVNISTFVQCCAYSVGQAAQPILSANFGAAKWGRIKETLTYALYTALVLGVLWTALTLGFPNTFIRIFMTTSDAITDIAPRIMRTYCISFLLLPLNVFSTYYFQSILKPLASLLISVFRGIILSGLLILVLPLWKADALWLAMPITELITSVAVICLLFRYTKRLDKSL